jgi:hypothetical protein
MEAKRKNKKPVGAAMRNTKFMSRRGLGGENSSTINISYKKKPTTTTTTKPGVFQ